MGESRVLCLQWIEDLPPKNHRGLAWLVSRPIDEDVNGKPSFDALPESPEQRQFLARFDAWLEWVKNDDWYHGWPGDKDYSAVFQFRYSDYRLMGFLCHPDPDNKRYHMCVLVRMVTKHTKNTDKTLKKNMQDYADTLDVEALYKNITEDCDKTDEKTTLKKK